MKERLATVGVPKVYVCGGGVMDALGATTALPTGSWKFVAATFDRGTIKLYVDDGVHLTAPYTKTSTVTRIDAGTARLTVGADSSLVGGFMNGGIDEVHLFDRALSDSEVKDLYDSFTTPTTPKDKSHATRRYFDGLGRETLVRLADMLGNKVDTWRDVDWSDQTLRLYVPAAQGETGKFYTYAYDFGGRQLAATTPGNEAVPAGTVSSVYYDKEWRVESVDALGRRSYGRTDLVGRTVETAQWNPATSSFANLTAVTYNLAGLPIRSQDAKGQVTTTYYDTLGNPKFVVYPNGKTAFARYDNNLRAYVRIDEMGRVSTLTYDNLGRVSFSTLKASLGAQTSYQTIFGYDSSDNLFIIDNVTTRIARTFDARHRMLTETSTTGGTSLTMNYSYDAAGKTTAIGYPVSGTPTANYVYDSLNRVVQVNYAGARSAVLSYDGANRLFSVRFWKGTTDTLITESYAYDLRDRVTQFKVHESSGSGSTDYLQLDYSYDRASEIAQVVDNAFTGGGGGGTNPKDTAFSYDGQGRLAGATGPWGSSEAPQAIEYGYDAVGNILTKKVDGGTIPYGYGPWNQLTSFGTETYTHNDAGSIVTKVAAGSATAYTYDFLQQLAKVVVPPGGPSNTYTYSYDGLGRRVRSDEGGTPSLFAYSGSTLMYTKVGASESTFVYVGGRILLRKTDSLDPRYYHQDMSGNVRLVTYYGTSVQVDGKYRYKPFGEMLTLGTQVTDPRLKFAGQELDAATGMYHMGARYDDPASGRFMSRDPVGSGYSYASNNPLSFYDPSGLYTVYYGGAIGSTGFEVHYDEPAPWWQPLKDNWDNTPEEWKFLLTVLISVAFVLLTVATLGASAAIVGILIGIGTGAVFTAVAAAMGAQGWDLAYAFMLGFDIGFAVGSALAYAKHINLFGRGLTTAAERGSTQAGAQAARAEIPDLPADVAKTFKNGEYSKTVLKRDLVVRRYFSSADRMKGRWFTRDMFRSRSVAVERLSLPGGNGADFAVEAVIPKGTVIYEGEAVGMFGRSGGGNQVYILDKLIPTYGLPTPVPLP